MQKTHITVLLAVAAMLAAGCSCRGDEPQQVADRYQAIDTVPLLVMQIQECSRLYTTEYKIHKIVTHDDVVRLRGQLLKQDINISLPLGDRKVAIPMDATVKAYIDFSQFSAKNVERQGQRVTIVLPDPQVELTSSKINQHEVKTYVGIVRQGFTDAELSRYEQQGRQSIIESIPRLGIIERARQDAALTLVPLLRQLGYREQDITITYRHDFNPSQILQELRR